MQRIEYLASLPFDHACRIASNIYNNFPPFLILKPYSLIQPNSLLNCGSIRPDDLCVPQHWDLEDITLAEGLYETCASETQMGGKNVSLCYTWADGVTAGVNGYGCYSVYYNIMNAVNGTSQTPGIDKQSLAIAFVSGAIATVSVAKLATYVAPRIFHAAQRNFFSFFSKSQLPEERDVERLSASPVNH